MTTVPPLPLTKSPISALFLLKFDVKTGYTIEWSKTIDESVSLKGLEFKSLPSGLHNSSRDVIAFVEDRDENSFPKSLIYGISVFKSNLNENLDSRAEVRMYSLGLLIDPEMYLESASKTNKSISLVWKPLIFASGWEYISDLESVLDKWLAVTNDDDITKYVILEDFFNNNKHHEEHQVGKDFKTIDQDIPSSTSSEQTVSAKYHQSHHMLLSLPSLLENFGPLIFKIWKLSLLRKRILIHNAESVELNCSFSYCISVISTIPRDILPSLITTGIDKFEYLQYYQPLYNVGVNDINYLDSIIKISDPGFIASTTDEILLYKQNIYDYSVKLSAEESMPEIISSSDFSKRLPLVKATQRDLRRFKLLYDEFDLYLGKYGVDDGLKWWLDITEPTSWKEYIWKGFSWWATLGENDRSNHDFEIDKEGLDNISSFNDQESVSTNSDMILTLKPGPVSMTVPTNVKTNGDVSKEVLDALKIVGYFQNMTVKIFQVLIEIIQNHESDDSKDDTLLKDDVIYVSLNDINEMGLDPYSSQDHEFIIELVKAWWDKEARVGNYVGNICC